MNRFASFLTALSLAFAGSSALANQAKDRPDTQTAKPQPVQMTDAQLDTVAAGQMVQVGLINIEVGDVTIPVRVLNNSVNDNQIQIQIPVAAGVGVGVLGLGAGNGIAGAFGRQDR